MMVGALHREDGGISNFILPCSVSGMDAVSSLLPDLMQPTHSASADNMRVQPLNLTRCSQAGKNISAYGTKPVGPRDTELGLYLFSLLHSISSLQYRHIRSSPDDEPTNRQEGGHRGRELPMPRPVPHCRARLRLTGHNRAQVDWVRRRSRTFYSATLKCRS